MFSYSIYPFFSVTLLDGRYALPPIADIDRISAATEKGVLIVTVPKTPAADAEGARRERKIEVSPRR